MRRCTFSAEVLDDEHDPQVTSCTPVHTLKVAHITCDVHVYIRNIGIHMYNNDLVICLYGFYFLVEVCIGFILVYRVSMVGGLQSALLF